VRAGSEIRVRRFHLSVPHNRALQTHTDQAWRIEVAPFSDTSDADAHKPIITIPTYSYIEMGMVIMLKKGVPG
jgi:hypothetical protein